MEAVFRGMVPGLREATRAGADGPIGFVRRHRRSWAAAAAGAALMGGVGAFETDEAAPWTLYSYWLLLMLAGAAFGAAAIDRHGVRPFDRRWLAAASTVIALAMTPLIYVMAGVAMGGDWDVERLPHLFLQALLVVPFILAIQMLLTPRLADVPASGARSADLLDCLPARLRGARLAAIEAEDHYLRFHTDAGSALVLMRFGDALDRLGAADGLQTHRSWWVARWAVQAAKPGGGRARLSLAGGIEAPVSRTFARTLRSAGWY